MKLTIKVLTIVCFLFFGLQFTLAQCDGTSDIIQNSRNLELTTTTNINVGMGNSFTATCSGVIEGVSFWTYRVPGTIGQTSVTVELYRNPFSNSRVLMSSYTTDISFQSEGSIERYFPFENSPSLVAGTVYGVRLINNEAGQIIDLDLHTGNRLAGGNMFIDNFNQSSPWSTRDLRFQIHYEDNVAPQARCRNITRALGANGTVNISTGNINNNSSDADSGIASFFLSQNTFDCSNIGENTVTLTVRDQNGNADVCQATVTITDESDPIITCPADITVYTDPGVPIAVTYNDIGYDDCSYAAPDGFTFLGAWEDKYFYLSDNTIQIDQAFAQAELLGGHVATIVSAEHNSFIRTAVDNIPGATNAEVLIGYNDVATEDTFVWHDGNTTANFENWAVIEPNNAGGNEDYTVMKSGTVAKWNDVRGTTIRRYILQLSPALTQTSGFASGDFFPVGTTTNTFEATDAFGNTGTCSFDVTVIENPFETMVELSNGKLTITDIETDSDDQITLSNDGTILTISNLILPTVSGGPVLQDLTTVTIQLADITNGIEFIGGNGDNTITFTNAISLIGTTNGITLNDINTYSQSGLIDIAGDFTINGNPGGTVALNSMNARNLSIIGVDRVNDAGGTEMNISGTTTLQTILNINLNSGVTNNTQFGGLITITASNVFFSSRGDANFGAITTTGIDSSILNGLTSTEGNITLSGPIQTAGDSNLSLRVLGGNLIEQTASGTITTNRLRFEGNTAGTTNVILNVANNDISTLQVNNQSRSIATCNFTDINTVELDQIYVDELLLTANTIELSENTEFNKNGAGTSNFNGNINVTTTDSVNPAVINHNGGTINFNGTTTNFDGALDYNGTNGVISNFSGTTSLGTLGISPFFGNLNSTGTFTIDVFSNLLNEARFSGASAVLKGRASLVGAPVIVENDATITPGSIGDVTSLSLSDLSITDATFAPTIENDDDYDILEVQGTLTLTNATFNPIINSGTIGNNTIVLIDNDGTDAIVGTFNNYPEGSTILIGDYIGVLSYVGGDGNDMTMAALETTVELFQGKLEIADVGGSVSDDQITFSNDGTIVTISGLTAPVTVAGGPTLTDATTVTIPLASITGGIEFISGNGNNTVTIQDDLTLSGATNFLKLNNLAGYTQTGAVTIGGTLEIIGDGNIIINLNEITAGSLSVTNNAGITDVGGTINISGVTQLESSGAVFIDNGFPNHNFGGLININASNFVITAGTDITLGELTTPVPTAPLLNYIGTFTGSIDFSDNVTLPGAADVDTSLQVFSKENITQSGGIIDTDFLILLGDGTTTATLGNANQIRGVAAQDPVDNTIGLANMTLNSVEAIALETIRVGEFNITSPTIRTFPEFTNVMKMGAGESVLNGNFFAQNGTGSGIIEHTSGTITINGDTIDLTARITYNGAAGTITNLNAIDVRLPFTSDNASVTFGTLNANTNVNIGDDTITIFNEANFNGSGTVVNGTASISGGTTIISDAATITPGTSNIVASVTTGNFEITDATYAPRIESDTSFDNISVVGSVTLSNATLSPTEGFVSNITNAPIILISNDGIDPVIGTFNNLPENAGVSFGDYVGMITYTGGNGNDVSLVPDTIDPIAICQDLNLAIGLDGVTINATQLDNGSSDNAGIASMLVNGQSQIDYTYEDLGSHAVTLTITDTSGNTAECMATITLTSNVTFPILISEYQPQPIISNANQNIELKGAPGEAFLGVLVVIENDADTGNEGLVLSADTIAGTFNPDGLLVASIPNIADPSHTVVLTTSFSGIVGVTNVGGGSNEERNTNTVDLSTFGIILDAVGVSDGGACCPVDSTIGAAFGGVDVPAIGAIPAEIFRNASTGDFFQIKPNGDILGPSGAIVDATLFDTAPTNNGTFGQINPTISINMNATAFITTWKTDNSGSSSDNQITIFTDSNETYNYIIDWGDGTSDTNVTGNITHTYSTAGTYTIGIIGTFPKFVSNGRFSGDALKLITVDQWGSIAWNSFDNAFFECRNMDVVATDTPDLSNVTSLASMFADCRALIGNATFNTWDVSNIQTMQLMFSSALNFNQSLNGWNVSNVTNMSSMFNTAEKFNQDLDSWNTSQVQLMDFMFLGALDFNGNISNWNVANVTEMSWMFNNAEDFNQDLNNWNTGQVQEMDFMFLGATAFNGDISSWNTGQVTTMNAMFQNATAFNQDITGWNVANVTDMGWMFNGATLFNQPIGNWNVSNVTAANEMLLGSAFSNENYDDLLLRWSQLTLQNNVSFGTDASYCIGEIAKQNIITNHTWNFTDNGVNCDAFFITKWETTTANESITIPTTGSGYNYNIDWGDGTIETDMTGVATHNYTTAGQYEVKISGNFPRIYFSNNGDRLKVLEVMQWGNIAWTSMENAFYGCENLHITATDAPDLSSVISMKSMFRQTAIAEDISHWDVSTIQNMSFMFRGCTNFNIDISTWNINNVQNFASFLYGTTAFNRDLSSWDMSNATEIRSMFRNATAFNQDLSSWDISNITSASEIFSNTALSTENYDAILKGWATLDTAAGETAIPNDIAFGAANTQYCEAEIERQILINTYNWNITDNGKAADCNNSFITSWETTMDNESITIPTTGTGYNYLVNWGDGTVDIGITGDASHTYATAGTYTVSITGDFPRIYFNYSDAGSKIQEVTQWGTTAWTSMESAFAGCENLDVTATDTPNLSNVISTNRMFTSCSNLLGNATFNTWDVSNIQDMTHMFSSASNFNTDLNNWNVSNVTNMNSMFSGATIFNGNISTWNTGEVTDMFAMFANATAFEGTGGLNSWNVSKVENMASMFRHAEAFNQNLNNWNIANVTEMSSIFWGATAFNGDISTWDISGLTHLNYVFREATSFNGDLSQWNVSNILSLDNTFYGASSFNTDLNTWNVSNVTTMQSLFDGASSFNKPLDTWDVSNVSFMYRMFYNATNFNQDVSSWDVSLNQSFSEMFLNTSMSVENYDLLLIAWADLTLRNNLQFGISSEYCLGAEAKQYIMDTFNWSFTDEGLNSDCTARFVTTWGILPEGESITIPTIGTGYNYQVNWGDGTIDTNVTGDITHTYSNYRIYTVTIVGDFPRIYFNNQGDKDKILSVEQWGSTQWTSMAGAFHGCFDLELNTTDAPDLSNVTDMTSMFEGASTLNTDISSWDVSNVTVMDRMLYGTTLFDQDLGDWNISNVTSMDDMLTNAMLSTANYDNTLIGWRTLDPGETQIPSGITFSGGDSAFCLSDYEREELIHTYNWTITDAGKSPDCTNRRFITTWKTESNNESITIPTNGGGYNYLVDWGDGTVDIGITGNATHSYATAGTYTVSITGDFPRIYFSTNHNTQIQSIDQWGSNRWDSMLRAFSTCRNLDVVATDVPNLSNVTNMGRMFFGCNSLVGNAQFNNWDVSRVNNFGSTFQYASSFNQPLNNWDVSRAIKLTSMFSGATSFDQSLADWDLSSLLNSGVANATNMFAGVTLSTENYDATLIGWATLDPGETRIPSPVTFGGGNSQYCLSDTQRQTLIDTYGWTITDGGFSCGIKVDPKVYLQGAALNPNTGEENLMRDDLRVAGFIPTRSPYADMISCEATVFDVTGNDAIVDWVWVELRDATDNTSIIAGQSALLQRDGDIVSADGVTNVEFDIASGNYYIAIKHRNHLGTMSANSIALSNIATMVDFSNGSIPTFGSNAQTTFGMPSGILAIWTGNVNGDTVVQYSGVSPDTPDILSEILNDPGNFLNFPTYAVSGYKSYDINMDGNTQYSGTNPDTPVILQNVIAHPGNFLNFSTYQIIEQLPSTNN